MENYEDKTREELIRELQALEKKYFILAKLYSNGTDSFNELKAILAGVQEEIIFQKSELKDARNEIELQNKEKRIRAEAIRELEAFSYSVSHDLKAPLRHIRGFVDLLLNRYYQEMPDKAKHYLQNIAQSSEQMDILINDLLEFSRTGRREMQKGNVDMSKIVEDVLLRLKTEHSNRSISWQVSRLPLVFADESMLYQVWTNLLGNAVKYTRNKEKAVIKVEVTEKKDEYIFSVIDNGIGFDMKYAKNLFGVFQRLHSFNDYEGTGIGLAIVRNIILKHKGLTWAEAEPDKGAAFYFTLPKQTEK